MNEVQTNIKTIKPKTNHSSGRYLQTMVLSHRPLIQAYNGDCMDWMQATANCAYDLAIVDPPYGIGADKQKESYSQSDKGYGRRHRKKWDDKWDKMPTDKYFTELRRVSKNQIIWGGNYFELPATRCVLIWDKIQNFNGSDFELAWTSFYKPAKAFRMSRIEAYSNLNGGELVIKIHPTQKPVALYRWLLQNYAKAGQRILDTHGGSFSSAVACHTEGYEMDICEIDAEYFEAGVKRFKQAIKQMDLFNVRAV